MSGESEVVFSDKACRNLKALDLISLYPDHIQKPSQ